MHKVLIIEDEIALLDILASKLTKEGYDVSKAYDGEEALKKIRYEKPDVILLDIIMPKVGGFEVLEALHTDKELSNIPVIIISNSGQPVEIEKAKALGAKEYLIKAEFDPNEVLGKLQKVLNANSSKTQDARDELSSMIKGTEKEELHGDNNKAAKNKTKVPLIKYKALVVEDDQFLRDLIVKKLEEEGFETTQAIDGEGGLQILKQDKPDIVLLDLILPGIDGFEVLKKIKEDKNISSLPVIVLSNLGQKDDIERGLELGAVDYLIKAHFTPGEIVQRVRDILKK